ncbi:MAG TPA: DUF72 domain-containing protein [Chryseosolibacter sp.]|nr:DUF72 domain-containing protein [Chryseosolibacter sp.]
MVHWKIGCSGYHYADWKHIFYPENMPARKWFEHYCTQFNSLELNVTFYRFPKPDFLRGWYSRCPENFTFTVKAPRLITHFKRLNEAQHALNNFYATVGEGLREKLGCILFQFPSSFVFEEHRLERIVNLIDPRFRNVIEFRHESWWNPAVFNAFSRNNIAFTGMSHPNLDDHPVQTSSIGYYRFHGVPHLYTSRYDAQTLERIAQEFQNMNGLTEAYIYFNNTADGAAIVNAKQFQELCEAVSREH